MQFGTLSEGMRALGLGVVFGACLARLIARSMPGSDALPSAAAWPTALGWKTDALPHQIQRDPGILPLAEEAKSMGQTRDAAKAASNPASALARALVPAKPVFIPRFPPSIPRILCWVPLRRPNDTERHMIVESWYDECDKLVFLSRDANDSLLVTAHNYSITHRHDLWNIVHRGWALMYTSKEWREYDYFIKIDTDTYFSGYNFKNLVSRLRLNASEPQYLGHIDYHKPPSKFALGLAIAISRGTLLALGPHLPTVPGNAKKCEVRINWAEDWEFYKCLKQFGLHEITQSYDRFGRESFMVGTVSSSIKYYRDKTWMWENVPSTVGIGVGHCSVRPVVWHLLKIKQGLEYYWRYLFFWMKMTAIDPLDLARGG